jgi:hypothetical protein
VIVTKSDYSPTQEERLDSYLAELSNHIERCVIRGEDPRNTMRSIVAREMAGLKIQLELSERFR